MSMYSAYTTIVDGIACASLIDTRCLISSSSRLRRRLRIDFYARRSSCAPVQYATTVSAGVRSRVIVISAFNWIIVGRSYCDAYNRNGLTATRRYGRDGHCCCSGSPSASDCRPASPECNPNRTEDRGVVPLSSTYGACLRIGPAESRPAVQVILLYTRSGKVRHSASPPPSSRGRTN